MTTHTEMIQRYNRAYHAIQNSAETLDQRFASKGWSFDLDPYAGSFYFAHEDADIMVFATPHFDGSKGMPVSIVTGDSDVLSNYTLGFSAESRSEIVSDYQAAMALVLEGALAMLE